MSAAMTPPVQKPAAAFLSPTPDFKMGGLLPQTPGDVSDSLALPSPSTNPDSYLGRLMIRLLLVMLVSGLSLQGCAQSEPERLGTPIEGYSHTSAAINRFSVNGNGGPNLSPYGYGGGQMCCAPLPVKWHPGLTVVVEWEKDPNPHDSANWPDPPFSDAWRKAAREHENHYTRHRAVVAVAPYEDLGLVNVHFLPCNQVAVSAGATYPGRPDYPFQFPQKMDEPATCPKP